MTITMSARTAQPKSKSPIAALFAKLLTSPPTSTTYTAKFQQQAEFVVAGLSITNAGFTESVVAEQPSVADSLRRVHAQSKLTWTEIAATLGVSRRTVHNWLAGMVVSPRHAADLAELTQLISEHSVAGESPDLTRSRLIAPDANGRSPLTRMSMTRTAHPSRSRIPAATRLSAEAVEESPAPPLHRGTKLRAVSLKPR
jgi:DNA-binding transcriptional regulator YiaG